MSHKHILFYVVRIISMTYDEKASMVYVWLYYTKGTYFLNKYSSVLVFV